MRPDLLVFISTTNLFQPKFLSREEREALALKKREEEVARQKEQQKQLLERRKQFIQEGKKSGQQSSIF